MNLIIKKKRSFLYKTLKLLLIVFYFASCQDFSRFECFNQEEGCEGPNHSFEQAQDSWVQPEDPWSQPISSNQIDDRTMSGGTMSGGTMSGGTMSGGTMSGETMSGGFNETECEPLELLGPCRSCNIRGEIEFTQRDDGCEVITCNPSNHQIIPSNIPGQELCQTTSYRPKTTQCNEQGSCIEDPQLFCEEDTITVIIDRNNECMDYSGCIDSRPLVQNPIRFGESCDNNQGTCNNNGECIPNLSCPSTNSASYCSSDISHCTYSVNLGLGAGVLYPADCNEVCGNINGVCVAAWNEGNYRCQNGANRNCGRNGGLAICKCRL